MECLGKLRVINQSGLVLSPIAWASQREVGGGGGGGGDQRRPMGSYDPLSPKRGHNVPNDAKGSKTVIAK